MITYSKVLAWMNGKSEIQGLGSRLSSFIKENFIDGFAIQCGNCLKFFQLVNHVYAAGIVLEENKTKENIFYVAAVCSNCNYFTLNNINEHKPINLMVNSSQYDDIINKISDKFLKKLFIEFIQTYYSKLNSSATLLSRKILMHIAVLEGAKENKKFVEYIEFIKDQNLVGKNWNKFLDKVKKLGNNENHHIKIANDSELNFIFKVIIALLKNIYEPNYLESI